MGNTWTVTVWKMGPDGEWFDYGFLGTESAWKALMAFWRAKRAGFGCVKLEWR